MSEQDDKIKELLEKAESLYNEGKYKEAIEVLLEANELKQKDYNILCLLGKSYYMDNQYKEAIKYFSEVLKLKPNDYNILRLLGDSYYCMNNQDREAIKYYSEALKLKPEDTYILKMLGKACLTESRFKEAIDYLSRAIKLDESLKLEILGDLGEAYCLDRDTEIGIDCFVEKIELKRDNLSYLIVFADAYDSMGKFKKAEETILRAIKISPNNSYIRLFYNYLGHLCYRNKEYEKAKDYFSEAIKLNSDDSDSKNMVEKIEKLLKNK